ncbi:MAG: hypothetical protein FD137_1313, partial [Spirochaetes bacterium]
MDELLKKMNYKGGTIHVAGAPKEFSSIQGSWKSEAEVREILAGTIGIHVSGANAGGPLPFLLVFAASEAEVKERIPSIASRVGPGTVFWVAFPKKTSPNYNSDINRDILWKLMEPLGFRPNRNVAIDED